MTEDSLQIDLAHLRMGGLGPAPECAHLHLNPLTKVLQPL
jgi:hypothetical protein